MSNALNICFIGGGNMARAIIGGLKNNRFAMSTISVIEPNADKRLQLAQDYHVQVNDPDVVLSKNSISSSVIVLAVKPQQMHEVCRQLSPLLNTQLVISIAAGVKSHVISNWLNNYRAIVRVMPNTPAQIQAGISALYAMPTVNSAQRAQAEAILQATGKTIWLGKEEDMDAITAISGSGPAYVFYLIEALQEAAIALGLSAEQSRLLSIETFTGASLLAKHSTDDVKTLRAQVTSVGGTTEQGILKLESADIKNTILLAAQAAAEKSRILGEKIA